MLTLDVYLCLEIEKKNLLHVNIVNPKEAFGPD